MRILKLTEDTRKDILQNLLKRSPNNYGEFEGRVNAIIEEVRNNRDQAVFNYTKQFDGADINAGNILVTEEEIAEAYEQVDTTLLAVIRKSLVNIKKYHEKQVQNSWFTTEDGIILGQKVTALATVGVYVPGGKAVYPSSVLMNVLPAKVARVDRIVMCTPPGKDGKVYPSTLFFSGSAFFSIPDFSVSTETVSVPAETLNTRLPPASSSVTRIPGRIPLRSFRMFTIYRIRSLNTISLSLRLAVTYGI